MGKKPKEYSYNIELFQSGVNLVVSDGTAVPIPSDFMMLLASDLARAWLQTQLKLDWQSHDVKPIGQMDVARYGSLVCEVHERKLTPGTYVAEVRIGSSYTVQAADFETREAAKLAIPTVIASLFDTILRGELI